MSVDDRKSKSVPKTTVNINITKILIAFPNVGSYKKSPFKILSIIFACISTPGRAKSYTVERKSAKVVIELPIKINFPFISFGSKSPFKISKKEIYLKLPFAPLKFILIKPLLSVGISIFESFTPEIA